MLAYARAHAPPPRQEGSKPAGQHSLPAWSHASSGAHIAQRILALLSLLGARFMLSGALAFATMANPFFLRPWFRCRRGWLPHLSRITSGVYFCLLPYG